VLYRSELPRGGDAAIVGTGDRQARRVVSALLERGVLLSDSTRAAASRIPCNTRRALDAEIRPHLGSQAHGFEELSCQIASLEARPASDVFYRKGLGADAGVECFVKHGNGSTSSV
jgi:hypothetical protein